MADPSEKKQMIDALKEQLMTRGIHADPYINALLAFQKLLDSLKTHDQIEVSAKILQAMIMVLEIKHKKFHDKGGDDEKRYSDFN